MAGKTNINAEGAEARNHYMVPIEGIVVEQRNNNRFGTYTEEDLKDLLADIKAGIGIHTPVLCRPLPDRRPLLVFGYRRYAAVKLWNNNHKPSEAVKLPVMLREMNEDEALEHNVNENVARRDLTPMDAAIGIRNLSRTGKTDDEVAVIFRRSPAWVSQMKKLLSLERPLQLRIHKEEIPCSVGIELSEISAEHRGIVTVAIENDFKGKFTLTNLHKVCREIGAIGDGVTPTIVTHDANATGDLLASTHTRGHTPKRKQRTMREFNDYWDKWELEDKITDIGRRHAKLQRDFIAGRVTNETMDAFMLSQYGANGANVNRTPAQRPS